MNAPKLTIALLSSAIILSSGIARAAEISDWEREFGIAGQQASVLFTIGLQVKSVEDSESKIDKMLAASGGTLMSMNANNGFGYYGGYVQPNGVQKPRPMKMIVYQVPVEKAEMLARRLLDLGVIQNYTRQPLQQAVSTSDMDERIKEIEKELGDKSMENLPAARALLSAKLARLKQSRDSFQSNADKARITINLQKVEAGDVNGASKNPAPRPDRKGAANQPPSTEESGD